jgi:Fibronectin type III domain
VAAVNPSGAGATYSEDHNTPTPTSKATLAPTNVAVVAGNTQATVIWDPVVGAVVYSVTVATSPGGPEISGSGSSSGPSYTATGLTNGRIYYFRVQSSPSSGWPSSAYSSEVSATSLAALPLAPTGLDRTSGNTQLSLTWTAVSGATSYKVYRTTEGSDGRLLLSGLRRGHSLRTRGSSMEQNTIIPWRR